MRKNKVDNYKLSLKIQKRKVLKKNILYGCSWLSFLIAILLLTILGKQKAEQYPYFIYVCGFILLSIIFRILMMMMTRNKKKGYA